VQDLYERSGVASAAVVTAGSCRLQQVLLTGQCYGLRAVVGPQLVEDGCDVKLDSPLADRQGSRNLLVGEALRQQLQPLLLAPAEREEGTFEPGALDALYAAADGYPYFVQAYGKVTWDVAACSPVTASDVGVAGPVAATELAVGFFGSRYERATPSEREYMRAMALLGDEPVPTAQVAQELGRKPASVSPARDSLIKKGLIYSSERGLIAFTVPHFGRFLRAQPA